MAEGLGEQGLMGADPPWDPHAPWASVQSLESLAQLTKPKMQTAGRVRPVPGTGSSHSLAGAPQCRRAPAMQAAGGRDAPKLGGSNTDTRHVSQQQILPPTDAWRPPPAMPDPPCNGPQQVRHQPATSTCPHGSDTAMEARPQPVRRPAQAGGKTCRAGADTWAGEGAWKDKEMV